MQSYRSALEQFVCRPEVSYVGHPAGGRGAFPAKGKWTVTLEIPRALGALEIIFAIHRDGEEAKEYHLPLLPASDHSFDRASVTLDLAELCAGRGCGLFYYEFFFVRHGETLFSTTQDQVSFSLIGGHGNSFRIQESLKK